jgi:hypothetical protein
MLIIRIFLCITIFLSSAPIDSIFAAENSSQQLPVMSSTLADQSGVELTVYNVNLGMVKDRRNLNLAKGRGELFFMDVAAQILPASVQIRSLTDPEGLMVMEQNYEYDLISPQKLMDKYVGKEVQLYQKNPYTEREELVTATLLANNGGPIYRINNELTFNYPGRVIFPALPEMLIARPTLAWLLENNLSKPQSVETSYLTSGITWKADYLMTLNEDDTKADLSGWVTIDNESGASYRNATLKLVAGNVNLVREGQYRGMALAKGILAETAPAPQFKEEGFFEYHIYYLSRPSTIKDSQSKQISLFKALAIPVKKELLFRGTPQYYFGQNIEVASDQKVGVFIEIANSKGKHLGIPLPSGKMGVYKRDDEGGLQFIGEDTIEHTAKDEKLRIKVGNAFDVVARRKRTDWKKTASDTYETAVEIDIRNHKQEDVLVRVVEPIPGDWQMLSSSMDYTKGEAHTAEFSVPVKKDGEARLTYRVRMRY